MKNLQRLALLFFMLMSTVCGFAEENPPLPPSLQEELKVAETASSHKDFSGRFLEMLFYLGSLVALMYGGTWFVKKMTGRQVAVLPSRESTVKMVDKLQISGRTTVYIVDYEGHKLGIAESVNGQVSITEIG